MLRRVGPNVACARNIDTLWRSSSETIPEALYPCKKNSKSSVSVVAVDVEQPYPFLRLEHSKSTFCSGGAASQSLPAYDLAAVCVEPSTKDTATSRKTWSPPLTANRTVAFGSRIDWLKSGLTRRGGTSVGTGVGGDDGAGVKLGTGVGAGLAEGTGLGTGLGRGVVGTGLGGSVGRPVG